MLHCVKDISFFTACSWQLKATNKVATSKEEEKKRRGGKVERYRNISISNGVLVNRQLYKVRVIRWGRPAFRR